MATPFKTIIAGTNGVRGRGAAALAQVIARAIGARLLLVGVECEMPIPMVETAAQLRETLEADVRDVRDEVAPDAQTLVAFDLTPARALRRIAKDERADLIVVGSHHRGRIERFTSGDGAMQVLHGVPCAAVAVAPDHLPATRALQRIGVGLNGTPDSEVALDLALQLAMLSGARVQLLAVASDVYAGAANLIEAAAYATTQQQLVEARVERARGAIARAHEACGAVPADGDVRVGDATAELIELSRSCDLLVLGSRRWGPIRRPALGSTAERVMRTAKCPVLVPRRNAASEHDDDARHAVGHGDRHEDADARFASS